MPDPAALNGQRPPVNSPPRQEAPRPAKTSLAQLATAASPAAKRPPDELEGLIRARYPVIYVVTWEEERLEHRLLEIAKKRNKTLHVWSCSQGIVAYGG